VTKKVVGVFVVFHYTGNSYEFEELEGRTELEGLGVISRFDDGNLISKFGTVLCVQFYYSCICKYI
jgi:hypothetical protein